MFEEKQLMFIYTESPLHVGANAGLGAIDLPIQRARTTQYPIIQSSGIKGGLRSAMRENSSIAPNDVEALFGPETDNADAFAGAISFGDANILLFPVRSLAGVYAWVTCPDILNRFILDLARINGHLPDNLQIPEQVADTRAIVGEHSTNKAAGQIVLEENCFTPETDDALISALAEWIGENAFPDGDEYTYWKNNLPRKLCVLSDNSFTYFVRYCTSVQTHNKLNPDTKTAANTGLWVTESLPEDSLLYTPIFATKSRSSHALDASAVMQKLKGGLNKRIQLGGSETTGQGFVALHF